MKSSFKALLLRHGANLQALHANELSPLQSDFVKDMLLPVLIRENSDGSLDLLADREKLQECNGSVDAFERILVESESFKD